MEENKLACFNCGRIGYANEMTDVNGYPICDDCFDNNHVEVMQRIKENEDEYNIEEKVVNAKVMNGIHRFIMELIRLEKDAGNVMLAIELKKIKRKVGKEGTVADIEGIAGEVWQAIDGYIVKETDNAYDRGMSDGKEIGYDDGYRDGSDDNEDY